MGKGILSLRRRHYIFMIKMPAGVLENKKIGHSCNYKDNMNLILRQIHYRLIRLTLIRLTTISRVRRSRTQAKVVMKRISPFFYSYLW